MQCVATITSQWGGRGYSGRPISKVENFTVDTAMDTDADQWSIDIGDPHADLIDILNRDSEVRAALALSVPGNKVEYLLQGYADQIGFTQDGILSMQGRDLSAAAVDDTAQPQSYPTARPDVIIRSQAITRGFAANKINIPKLATIPKLGTDGSESVWAFWYRMVRTKKMFIWVDSDGTLTVSHLNYAAEPTYFFGTPLSGTGNPKGWIPVQTAQITKNTSTRLGAVWAYGTTGAPKSDFIARAHDRTITTWVKKPLKIIQAQAGHTNAAKALQDAQEELFESIVGSLEITLQIMNPGFLIRQNRTAYLNLPKMGYKGEFFVVGVRIMGSSDGIIQEIRLREKKYALSRRVPQDPLLQSGPNASSYIPSNFVSGIGGRKSWDDYFLLAAQKWHGAWPIDLFLAGLYGICEQETGFRNIREGNLQGPEWSPPPSQQNQTPSLASITAPNVPGVALLPGQTSASPNTTLVQWKKDFANSSGDPYNPYNREAGVGPMQLTDLSRKKEADAHGGVTGEFTGSRWDVASNIYVAAHVLIDKLNAVNAKAPDKSEFARGIEAYNGVGATDYRIQTMRKVDAYLPTIQKALTQTQAIQAPGSTKTTFDYGPAIPDKVRKIINFCERQIGKPYQAAPGETTGPDTYDCSGLAYRAYQAAGYDQPRGNTNSYFNNGKDHDGLIFVPVDRLSPGDMVFFNVINEGGEPPQHMGIFYHDGQMIVAPQTGEKVKIESIAIPSVWTIMGGMRLAGVWPTTPSDSSTYNPQNTSYATSPQHTP